MTKHSQSGDGFLGFVHLRRFYLPCVCVCVCFVVVQKPFANVLVNVKVFTTFQTCACDSPILNYSIIASQTRTQSCWKKGRYLFLSFLFSSKIASAYPVDHSSGNPTLPLQAKPLFFSPLCAVFYATPLRVLCFSFFFFLEFC